MVARGILCRTAPKRSLQKGPSRGGTSKIADPGVAGRDGTRPNGGGRGEYISQEDPGFTWGPTPGPHPRCHPSLTMPHPETRKNTCWHKRSKTFVVLTTCIFIYLERRENLITEMFQT
jgi:hypothetical protein